MGANAAFPHSQHWTVQDFRVTVMFYKRDGAVRCTACGTFPARHAVWADGRGDREGWSAHGFRCCDSCRPEKGTLPALDYVRLVQGAGMLQGRNDPVIYERTEPWPGQSCITCAGPAVYRAESRCGGCGDPELVYTTQRVATRAGGVTQDAPEAHHRMHPLGWEYRCAEHPLKVAP
jgi:hypothetical protein